MPCRAQILLSPLELPVQEAGDAVEAGSDSNAIR